MSLNRSGRSSDAPSSISSPSSSASVPGKQTLVSTLTLPIQRKGGGPAVEDPQAAAAAGTSGTAHALPHLDAIQRSFGSHDVGHVQAYSDDRAARGAEALGAEAFATGSQVVFAGAPSLHTAAHEAAHVVQQRGGVQLKGGMGEEGDAHERHADAVADAVVRGESAEALLGAYSGSGGGGGGGGVQLRRISDDFGYDKYKTKTADELRASPALDDQDRENIAAVKNGQEVPHPVSTTVSDDDIEYTAAIDAQRESLRVLSKPKAVYKSKDKSDKNILGRLVAGRAVTVLEEPKKAGKMSRTWAHVEATIGGERKKGYINTSEAIDDKPLEHAAVGAVMPVTGPLPEHVAQHMFGDCFLLAALMGLTRIRPDYVRHGLFQTDPTQPGDSHTIKFFKDSMGDGRGPFAAEQITVSNTVLRTSARVVKSDGSAVEAGENVGSNGDAQWPAIIEKAFAAWPGRGQLDKLTGGQGHRAAGTLTGEQHDAVSTSTAGRTPEQATTEKGRWKQQLIAAVAARAGVLTAGTKGAASDGWKARNRADGTGASGGEGKVGGIAFGHVYEIVDAVANEVHLRNPWGHYSRVRGITEQEAAISILTWDEFFEVVDSWSTKHAPPPAAAAAAPVAGAPAPVAAT